MYIISTIRAEFSSTGYPPAMLLAYRNGGVDTLLLLELQNFERDGNITTKSMTLLREVSAKYY
jgi:hypothetical protein